MRKKKRKISIKKKQKSFKPPAEVAAAKTRFPFLAIVIVLLISIVSIWPLFSSTSYVTHDGVSHLSRFSQFITAFSDGQFLVRWLPGFMEGYGLPIYIIYPPLPAYFVTALNLLGLSLIFSFKAVLALTIPLSGIAMYFFAREFFKKHSALLAAAAYMLAPYRFIDIYVRGAFNECLTFIFIPLIFLFIKKASEGKYLFAPFLSLSLAGLLLSHSPVPLMVMPFALGYAIFSAATSGRKHSLVTIAFGLLLGFGLSSFHLLVALIEKDYTVIGTSTGFLSGYFDFRRNFIQPMDLISPLWGYGISGKNPSYGMPYQLGGIYLICIIASLAAVRYIRDKTLKNTIFYFQIMSALCVFMMFKISQPIWEILPLISFLQFPWRFLVPTVFAAAFIVGALPDLLIARKKWRKLTLAGVLFVSPLITAIYLLKDKWPLLSAFFQYEIALWVIGALIILLALKKSMAKSAGLATVGLSAIILAAIPISAVPLHTHLWGSPQTLGSSELERNLLSKNLPETLPMGTANDVRFLPKTANRKALKSAAPVEIVAGNASIKSLIKNSNKMSFTIESSTDGLVLINIFHFPGWTVYRNNKKTEFQIDDFGRMLVDFPAGKHSIKIRFENTLLRKTANMISAVSLAILLFVPLGFLMQRSNK